MSNAYIAAFSISNRVFLHADAMSNGRLERLLAFDTDLIASDTFIFEMWACKWGMVLMIIVSHSHKNVSKAHCAPLYHAGSSDKSLC